MSEKREKRPAPRTMSPCQSMEDLQRIQRLVKQQLRTIYGVDIENLSGDIWIELWLKKLPVLRRFIHARVVDEIRRRVARKEMLVGERAAELAAELEPENPESASFPDLGSAVEAAGLTEREKWMIWLRFYKGASGEEIVAALELSVSPRTVNEQIQRALGKIREGAER